MGRTDKPLPTRAGRARKSKPVGGFVQVRSEDLDLVLKAQAGDVEAQNALVLKHMGFIHDRVRSALPRGAPLEEWLGYGIEVFILSIRGFDPAKAGSLLTYAGIGIERKIWQKCGEDGVIRLKPFGKGRKESSAKAWAACEVAAQTRWLDSPVRSKFTGERATLGALVPARARGRFGADERIDVAECMARLPVRQREIMRMISGGMTLAQAGDRFGICREYTRQIQVKGIRRVREQLGLVAKSAAAA